MATKPNSRGYVTTPIFLAGDDPFKGLVTSSTGFSLKSGYFALAKNVRTNDGAFAVRAGLTLMSAAPTTGTYSGSFVWENGEYIYAILALNDATKVRLYRNQYSLQSSAWGGWIEMTASSGKYGNSRMTIPTLTGNVVCPYTSFGVVANQNNSVYVAAQNGKDAPRVFNIDNTGGSCGVINTITPPTWASTTSPTFYPAQTLQLTAAHAGTTVTSAGTTFTPGITNDWDFAYAGGGAVGDYIQIVQNSGTLDISNSAQLWMIATVQDDSLFSCCTISAVRSGGGLVVLYDPAGTSASAAASRVIVPTNLPAVYLYAIPIQVTSPPNDVVGLRFTLKTAQLGASAGAYIYGLMAGGQVPGFAEYKVSYFNSGSFSESAGVVYQAPTPVDLSTIVLHNDLIINNGGTVVSTPGASGSPLRPDLSGTFLVPLDSNLYYKVNVPIQSPILADGNKGVDTVYLYRKDPDSEDFYSEGQYPCSSYIGSTWTISAPWSAFAAFANIVDDSSSPNLDYSSYGPDGDNEVMPVGTAILGASQRLYIATAPSTGNSSTTPIAPGSTVCASDLQLYFRFRRIAKFAGNAPDARSGFETRFPQGETVQAMLAASASILGSSNIYVWTEGALYTMTNFQARHITNTGTRSPYSVVERGGNIYFVDHLMVQRRLNTRSQAMSLRVVQDQFDTVARKDAYKISCALTRDRLLTLIPKTSAVTLVYYEPGGYYESLDSIGAGAGITPSGYHSWNGPSEAKALMFSSSCAMYDYANGTNDVGTKVTLGGLSGYIKLGTDQKVTTGAAVVTCTDQSGVTLAVTRYGFASGDTKASSIALPGLKTNTWLIDNGHNGLTDDGVAIGFSADVNWPFNIYGLSIDLKESTGHGPTAV